MSSIHSVKLGARVSFVPSAHLEHTTGFREILGRPVRATIVYVNLAHRYYMAEWEAGPGVLLRECFKF